MSSHVQSFPDITCVCTLQFMLLMEMKYTYENYQNKLYKSSFYIIVWVVEVLITCHDVCKEMLFSCNCVFLFVYVCVVDKTCLVISHYTGDYTIFYTHVLFTLTCTGCTEVLSIDSSPKLLGN